MFDDQEDAFEINLNTRSKISSCASELQFKQICERLENGINEVESIFRVADSLKKKSELNIVFRAQIVFLVSSLDFFIHEIFTYGLLQILNYEGKWRQRENKGNNDGYELNNDLKNMPVQFELVDKIINISKNIYMQGEEMDIKDIEELLYDIRTAPSNVTPAGIIKNLKMINIDIGMFPEDVFSQLKDLVEKRNTIAHNASMDKVKKDENISEEKINIDSEYIKKSIEAVREVYKIVKDAVMEKDL